MLHLALLCTVRASASTCLTFPSVSGCVRPCCTIFCVSLISSLKLMQATTTGSVRATQESALCGVDHCDSNHAPQRRHSHSTRSQAEPAQPIQACKQQLSQPEHASLQHLSGRRHSHTPSHSAQHETQHTDDLNHPGVAPQHASRYLHHLTASVITPAAVTQPVVCEPLQAHQAPLVQLPAAWLQLPQQGWPFDALGGVTELSPASSVLDLVASGAVVQARMPYTQAGHAPITTFCSAPASAGATETFFQERCVPGAADAGWDTSSGG